VTFMEIGDIEALKSSPENWPMSRWMVIALQLAFFPPLCCTKDLCNICGEGPLRTGRVFLSVYGLRISANVVQMAENLGLTVLFEFIAINKHLQARYIFHL
jgi:hypothetical protein